MDKTIAEDQVRIAVVLKDGRALDKYIEHAIGSAKNPMTDAQLESKFLGLTNGILPTARARGLIDLCWNIERAPQAADLARRAVA